MRDCTYRQYRDRFQGSQTQQTRARGARERAAGEGERPNGTEGNFFLNRGRRKTGIPRYQISGSVRRTAPQPAQGESGFSNVQFTRLTA